MSSEAQRKQEPGTKFDGGKQRFDLWYYPFLEEVHAVLVFGQERYGAWNWLKGMSYSRYMSAAMRHIIAWWCGEDFDPETGLSHLAHATASLMFLFGMMRMGKGSDDRLRLDGPS